MATERIQRQIDRLLDETEAALVEHDWGRVRTLAGEVLRLDPDNADARSFLDACERDGAGEQPSAPPPLASAPSTQERHQVTVFFSDLSGFTALNERLDPEDVRDIVNKIWGSAGEIVARYDGRVTKLSATR